MRNLGEKSNSVSDLRLIDCTSDFCQKRAWQCKSKIKIEILVFKKKKKLGMANGEEIFGTPGPRYENCDYLHKDTKDRTAKKKETGNLLTLSSLRSGHPTCFKTCAPVCLL